VGRISEAHGDRSTAELTTSIDWADVSATDLLERAAPGTAIRSSSPRRVELELRPFELVTLRFRAPSATI
jgi:alpha-mannosidase